ncbi:single-stranded DNA-binding protein [Clostridium botulinum D/C]|uniref:single-stranded DNA-binding protein n=1 Tax=Clostridium botulinum TaxID=1491 RepID=UPI001E3DBE91|nr:single-stranded DNA-binding protein [Clostridium botulinum]MCD3234298.1 single-stranded DNA-binding protein [Clostridium botulinum D/C]MCD3240282.1 single-stranded DNA-binding protein [Clostridium botulinum D/C]MCD3267717.1 single-stranded DNA-binding protein [Clostridium botulinum D/C]MCD3306114.1 single-stranded DNA-binding protein [Clostridium botulinum D/C]MCD3314898.1 single-stranded DNA-binding protein [Clostridium botulinum D/C]
MNRVVLIGRTTKDPELKFTPGAGKAVTKFILAVNRRYKKDGQPEADFLPIVVWGKIAENTANYVRKGSQIGVSGSIRTRSYEAKDGNKRYITEIVADEVQFLDSKNSSQSTGSSSSEEYLDPDVTPVDDGDIPF